MHSSLVPKYLRQSRLKEMSRKEDLQEESPISTLKVSFLVLLAASIFFLFDRAMLALITLSLGA